MPPRLRTFHLRRATDGKDRCVSRQARRAGPGGLSVGLSCFEGGTGVVYRSTEPRHGWRFCAKEHAFIDNECLPHPFRVGAAIPFCGRARCATARSLVWQSLVPSHRAVQLHRRGAACLPNPVKIASLGFGERHDLYRQSRPAGPMPRVPLSIHWFHVSILFSQQNVRRT